MLSRAAPVLKSAVRSSHPQPFAKVSSSVARPPGRGSHIPTSSFHTITATAASSATASSYRSSPEAARQFLVRLLTQLELAVPNIRANKLDILNTSSKLARVFRNVSSKIFTQRPVSTNSIAQNLSLSSRIALSGNARPRAFGAQYHFPRNSPISGTGARPFGRGVTAISNVGLGTARNFSSGAGGKPIFQNLVQNVPVAMRALYEADLDLNLRTEIDGMKKKFAGQDGENVRVRRLQKGLIFATVAVAPLAERAQQSTESKVASSPRAKISSRRERDLEHYFPESSSIDPDRGPGVPFITTLSIPLSPPSGDLMQQNHRTPLPPATALWPLGHPNDWISRTRHNENSRGDDLHVSHGHAGVSMRRSRREPQAPGSVNSDVIMALQSQSELESETLLYPDSAAPFDFDSSARNPNPALDQNPNLSASSDDSAEAGLLDLSRMRSMHDAYTLHGARVTALFAALAAADVWARGAKCEAFTFGGAVVSGYPLDISSSSNRRNSYPVEHDGGDMDDVRVLKVRFDGWSEEAVRALLWSAAASHRGLGALEWCEITSEPRPTLLHETNSELPEDEYGYEEGSNYSAYNNPWNASMMMSMPGPTSMSFIMPTLDFSSTFSDHNLGHSLNHDLFELDGNGISGMTTPAALDLELDSMIASGASDYEPTTAFSPSIALALARDPNARSFVGSYNSSRGISDDYLSAHEADEEDLNSTLAWSSDDDEPWYPSSHGSRGHRTSPLRPSMAGSASFLSASQMDTSRIAFSSSFIDAMA